MYDMPVSAPPGENDYKKRQEAIKRKLSEAAKKGDGEILKEVAKEESRDKPAIHDNCQMLDRLMHEGIEMYRDGEMTLKEMVDDLKLSLDALVSVVKDNSASEDDSE